MDELHGTLRLRVTLFRDEFPFRSWAFESVLLSPFGRLAWDTAIDHFSYQLQMAGELRESDRAWRLDATWEPAGQRMGAYWFIDRMAVSGGDVPDAIAKGLRDLECLMGTTRDEIQERRKIARLMQSTADAVEDYE